MKKFNWIVVAMLALIVAFSSCDYSQDTQPYIESPVSGGGGGNDDDPPIILGDTTGVNTTDTNL